MTNVLFNYHPTQSYRTWINNAESAILLAILLIKQYCLETNTVSLQKFSFFFKYPLWWLGVLPPPLSHRHQLLTLVKLVWLRPECAKLAWLVKLHTIRLYWPTAQGPTTSLLFKRPEASLLCGTQVREDEYPNVFVCANYS